jgi:hypothetical protein
VIARVALLHSKWLHLSIPVQHKSDFIPAGSVNCQLRDTEQGQWTGVRFVQWGVGCLKQVQLQYNNPPPHSAPM